MISRLAADIDDAIIDGERIVSRKATHFFQTKKPEFVSNYVIALLGGVRGRSMLEMSQVSAAFLDIAEVPSS